MSQQKEINSIQEFITEIEKLEGNYYFRGEPSTKYNEIIASAFREYPVPFSSKRKQINYKEALKDFYSEIGHQLSGIERENFLYYAQHHGVPTPLIDITINPLTALYFACSSKYSEKTCRVYAFDKENFINMSNSKNKEEMTLENFFIDNEFTSKTLLKISELTISAKQRLFFKCLENLKNLFSKDSSSPESSETRKTIVNKVQTLIRELEQEGTVEFSNDNHVKEFLNYFEIKTCRENDNDGIRISLNFPGTFEQLKIHYEGSYFKDKLAIAILCLIHIQKNLMVNDFINPTITDYQVGPKVIFPLVVIHPSVKFDRIKSQEGSFIYQVPFHVINSDVPNYVGFTKVESDIEFTINNKEQIYKSLEKLGINQKTIFPDHDNVATYLKLKQLMN